MSRKAEIKNYETMEDLEADYARYREEWDYNRDEQSARHSSGLTLSKVSVGGMLKVKYTGLPEWESGLKAEGLSADETADYLRMLKNQFVMITRNEPYVERPKTPEERLKILEENDAGTIAMIKKYQNFSDEKIQKIEKELQAYREERYQKMKKER